MGRGYQERDYEIIDYDLWELEGLDRELRGPRPATLDQGQYFACLGAAQTFGCYAEEPFPALIAQRIGLPALNLGTAGAGPLFFLRMGEKLLQHVNGARFAIVQVMSGRSEDNRVFESAGFEYGWRRSDGARIGAEPAWAAALEEHGADFIEEVARETRENWVRHFRELLESITVPKILFWFSRRAPEDYVPDYSSIGSLFGQFPHLVGAETVEQVKPYADEYVQCVTKRGLPQKLFSRFTADPATIRTRDDLGGEEIAFNTYYPSPEMHDDAAEALAEVCEWQARAARITLA
jgi:hypothetical protein